MRDHAGKVQNRMLKIASRIVGMRFVIFALFAAATIYCVLSIGRVKVNSDIAALLPLNTETRQGITVMEEEFTTCGTAQVMVSDISLEDALRLADALRAAPHVTAVSFENTEESYRGGSALYAIAVDAPADSIQAEDTLSGIKESLADYAISVSTEIGQNYSAKIAGEMGLVMALAAAVIIGVLLFTSRSYFEVVIFLIVFLVAGVLNMGTNFWLGEISSITNTVAVILQLALAIDYAIIFAHRYQDEAAVCADDREAVTGALAKSITEIFSSSLTTISGLIALTLIRLRLGYDLGVVLTKGIVCSMLTVFLLMPGLILLFPRLLRRTRHRSLVPRIDGWGRLLMKKAPVFLILFALILPLSIYFSTCTQYAFHRDSVTELVSSEENDAKRRISETFGYSTAVAVLVPSGDFESEKELLARIGDLDGVRSVTGLANIEAAPGLRLTDRCTAQRFAGLLNIDPEQAQLLFKAYSMEHAEFDALNHPDTYEVPLIRVALYLLGLIDRGTVTPTAEQEEMLASVRSTLEVGVAQLMGEHYDRLVLTSSLPPEGDESAALVDRIRGIAEEYYGEGKTLVIGEITSARDLKETYRSDSVLIAVLSFVFVFLILLVTFRSPVAAAVMVFVIQGSIWINFSIPYLCGMVSFFVTNMIVSAIQMGATIDYAIVIMNRYRALRGEYDKRTAMIRAVSDSFPTVITSGAIMAMAGFLIAYCISDVFVGHIGHAVGRGAVISMVMVLTVLPQLIVLCDKAIEKTTIRRRMRS